MIPLFHTLETPPPAAPGPSDLSLVNRGLLQVHVVSIQNSFPVQNAKVTI